jgi:predicted nucleic acid-binding protein
MASSDKVFFDTNVMVYQFDRTAPAKQKRAESLIEQCIREERAVISSQVVQEFMNMALKKFDSKFLVLDLKAVMAEILGPLCRHVPNFDFYQRTLDLFQANSLNFHDALIIQAAIELGCKTLYSEDLQDGQQFGTLVVKNPFKN